MKIASREAVRKETTEVAYETGFLYRSSSVLHGSVHRYRHSSGIVGLVLLPVDQYPQIVPPVVKVSASLYSGSERADRHTRPWPLPSSRNWTGTPGMVAVRCLPAASSGSFSATVTLDVSADPDLAAVDIQNRAETGRIASASRSGAERHFGGKARASGELMAVTLLSSDPKFDEIYLSNYATLNVLELVMCAPDCGRGRRLERRQPLLRHAGIFGCRPDKVGPGKPGAGTRQRSASGPEKTRTGSQPPACLWTGADGRRGHHDPHHRSRPSFVGRSVRVGDRNPGESGRLDASRVARRSAYLARSRVHTMPRAA